MNSSNSGKDTEISVIGAKSTAETNVSALQKSPNAAGRKRKWIDFYDRFLQKSCAVYMLIIAFIWLLHTIPIIVFFSIRVSVSVSIF